MKGGVFFSLLLNPSVGAYVRYEGLVQRHNFVGSFGCSFCLFSVGVLVCHIDTKLKWQQQKDFGTFKTVPAK